MMAKILRKWIEKVKVSASQLSVPLIPPELLPKFGPVLDKTKCEKVKTMDEGNIKK